MPKNKTHSGAKKRIRVTGSGKLVAEHQNNQHKFEYKSGSRKRRISGTGELSKADTGRMKKLLGL
jgi:large subunit ribosomal protein L35